MGLTSAGAERCRKLLVVGECVGGLPSGDALLAPAPGADRAPAPASLLARSPEPPPPRGLHLLTSDINLRTFGTHRSR
jgi:hypothetical protein